MIKYRHASIFRSCLFLVGRRETGVYPRMIGFKANKQPGWCSVRRIHPYNFPASPTHMSPDCWRKRKHANISWNKPYSNPRFLFICCQAKTFSPLGQHVI